MADPRFYRNHGPFELAAICAKAGIALPRNADGAAPVWDLAGLDGAAPLHLSFYSGTRASREAFARSQAGFCLVPAEAEGLKAQGGMILIPCASVPHAFGVIAALFYPDASLEFRPLVAGADPTARLGRDVVLGPGVVIGAGAQIGDRSRIGANTMIGPGVTLGHDCEIGSAVSISHAHVGDRVIILPGAQIGQPDVGLASSPGGHIKIPQLGRVLIQDDVEIGANCAIDRGALGDTIIGEGSKIDNLVQIGHNVQIGRHCVLVAPAGVGGSSIIEDFAVLSGQDSGGVPAKPIREWRREVMR